ARRDGDRWAVHGTAPYVLDGTTADELAVIASVDEGDGTGLFLVAADDVTATPVNAFDASRPLARIELDNVAVGPDRVLGRPGAVEPARRRALEEAAVAVALETVGTCQSIFDIA